MVDNDSFLNTSLMKGVKLLEYLSENINGYTFTEIKKELGFPKTTVHRYLKTFIETGFVRYNSNNKKYKLGFKLIKLGTQVRNQIQIRADVKPYLKELTKLTEETSNLALYNESGPIFVDNVESPKGVRMFSRIGDIAPFHATSLGKVILAFLSEEKVEKFIDKIEFKKLTPNTITDSEHFRIELNKISKKGYAVDNEEGEIGARCVGAPLYNSHGNVIGAISISGPSTRITIDRIEDIGEIVKEIAYKSSKAIGYFSKEVMNYN